MSLLNKDFLRAFGWSEFFSRQTSELQNPSLVGRVIGEEKSHYRIQYDFDRIAVGTIAGRLNFNAHSRRDFPAVGDWVVLQGTGDPTRVVISAIFERGSLLGRAAIGSGAKRETQVIAANVDWVLIATSANEDFNLRRLDRYVALARSAGAKPVVLLTKSDLTEDIAKYEREVSARYPSVSVHLLRALERDPSNELASYLAEGETSVVVGSSGVGKSTLLNRLLGAELLATREIRIEDGRGRHTTSSRYLFRLPGRGVLIDTPGMRELAMTDAEGGIEESFVEIETLVRGCRFGNCEHRTEPGCRVREALQSGELSEDLWESYQKLVREVRHQQRKADPTLQAQQKKDWKRITKNHRARRKWIDE